MATLALTAAVASTGMTGFSLFAAQLAAGVAGGLIDGMLFRKNQNTVQEGQRLDEIRITSSSESAVLPRVYGVGRVSGNLIWATKFKETRTSTTQSVGGKGIGGGGSSTTVDYSYSISIAVSICEGGERLRLGRVWADSKVIDLSKFTHRVYQGTETQLPDDKIAAVEGADNAPAFRGTAYILFEDMDLSDFGNRIPQFQFEVFNPLEDDAVQNMDYLIESVNIIPGSGEFTLGTTVVVADLGDGNSQQQNSHLFGEKTDMTVSMDALKLGLPNVSSANLVVSWFGTDLRLSECEIKPRIEVSAKTTTPYEWKVGGLTRSTAEEVSQDSDGNPYYGGTPSDRSVIEGIVDIVSRKEMKCSIYPFILMDIPPGNELTDPYGGDEQGAFPWRGRITVSSPSVDKTSAAATEVADFFGSVAVSNFSVAENTVNYSGSASDFGYRRFILHMAHLMVAASIGMTTTQKARLDKFYIGTEMVGLTRVRSGASTYPAIARLKTLAADVRGLFDSAGLNHVEISYAADWSEYHSHRPSDGSGDVFFPLDDLWSDSNIDFVAIDNYMPISDWRDGSSHLDFGTGAKQGRHIYDQSYLQSQILGGELYDYFYATDSDRNNQNRTVIQDLDATAEHWIFRQKDIPNWWKSTHRTRPGGDRSAGSNTSWVPESKRVVFSEFGCPAIDRGTNQPNVFFDPKSSESFFPYFSRGNRDDRIMRSYYEAMIQFWEDNSPTGMVDVSEMTAWTWDARSDPAFPNFSSVWSDTENHYLGHWLSGRVGSVPLESLLRELAKLSGMSVSDIDTLNLIGPSTIVRGILIDSIQSARDIVESLGVAFTFNACEHGGKIHFFSRSVSDIHVVGENDLVSVDSKIFGYDRELSEKDSLVSATIISFIDEFNDFQTASVGGENIVEGGETVSQVRLPIVMDAEYARYLSELIVNESWSSRLTMSANLGLKNIAAVPGDILRLTVGDKTFDTMMTEVVVGNFLEIKGTSTTVEESYAPIPLNSTRRSPARSIAPGSAVLVILDIPAVSGSEEYLWAPRLAAFQNPYPSSVDVWNVSGDSITNINTQIRSPSVIGEVVAGSDILQSAPFNWDRGSSIVVRLYDSRASLFDVTEDEAMSGLNAVALEHDDGQWEILTFANADFVSSRTYRLTTLLRGLLGTETVMNSSVSTGRKIVLLEADTLEALKITQSQKLSTLSFVYGPNGYDVAGFRYKSVTHQCQAVALKPYAPVHLSRNGTTFSWTRRTRFGGEDFEIDTVPLNESEERYEVEIRDSSGTTLLYGPVSTTSPEVTWVSAIAGTQYEVRVWQMSAEVGRGREARAVL